MVGEGEFFRRVAGESKYQHFDFLRRAKDVLGPDGNGVLHISGGLSEEQCDHLYEGLTNPKVDWLDAHDIYMNERGITVTQNFSTYALKLNRINPETPASESGIRELATKVQSLVRSLDGVFPTLWNWEVDEVVAQRYNQNVGLTWHKDLKRHPGVIVSASINGRADFRYRMPDTGDQEIRLNKGDLVIIRATYLNDRFFYRDLRPEYAVQNVSGDRISLTFRANTRPDDPIPGFRYNN